MPAIKLVGLCQRRRTHISLFLIIVAGQGIFHIIG